MNSGRNIALVTSTVAAWAVAGVLMAAPASAAGKIKEEYYGPSHGTALEDRVDTYIDHVLERAVKQSPRKFCSSEYDASDNYEYQGSVKDDFFEPESRDWDRRGRYGRSYDRRRCVPPRDIRYGLKADGWFDFSGYEQDDGVVCLRARRRDTGRLYEIELDSCSGLIVRAKPLRTRGFRRSRWLPERW